MPDPGPAPQPAAPGAAPSTPPPARSAPTLNPADGSRPRSWLGEHMADAVGHVRDPISAADVLRIQRHRVRDAAAADAQRGAIDVVEGVGLLVIVGIERLVSGPAPQFCLFGGLLVLGAGEQPARRDAGEGESVVVGTTVERGVLCGLAGRLQVGDQRALDAGRALGY